MSFSIQPTGWQYFDWQAQWHLPKNIAHKFYASWEDGLWDLIQHHQIPKNSTVLVPEFFCGDVVKNMASHGLKAVWYPVDTMLQTDPEIFAHFIKKHSPTVVVIFHAVGIKNTLFENKEIWQPNLSKETILIEDCVHRIINPKTLTLIHPRHIIMDSLRKVAPLAGSNMFGSPDFLNYKPTPAQHTPLYQLGVYGWWAIFQFFLLLTQLPFGKVWRTLGNTLAEQAMLTGYEIIGDSQKSGFGWNIFFTGYTHLNHKKIAAHKSKQVRLYQKLLTPLWKDSRFFSLPFSQQDAGQLRGFPVGLQIKTADSILTSLRNKGLLVRFELNDSVWATKQKIIYLPLGPHLNIRDIYTICNIILTS